MKHARAYWPRKLGALIAFQKNLLRIAEDSGLKFDINEYAGYGEERDRPDIRR